MDSIDIISYLDETTSKNDPKCLFHNLFWYDLDTLVRPNIPRDGRSITPFMFKDLDTFIGHTLRAEGRAADIVQTTEELINMWISFGRILNTLANQLDIGILWKLPLVAVDNLQVCSTSNESLAKTPLDLSATSSVMIARRTRRRNL